MGTSATLEISMKVKEYRSQGIDITNFGLGESPLGAPNSVKEQLSLNTDRTSYYPGHGIPELREKIVDFYKSYFDIHASPEQVVVGPGSKELIFHTMLALKSSWYFMSPSWVSYETQAKLVNRHFWRVFTKWENDYHLTVDDIRRQFKKTYDDPNADELIMLINYPNNPTGMTIWKDQVKKIARFARNNEIMILSDEIYANITHNDESHHSFYLEYPEGTIVTGGVSKDRSLGGYRLGVAILPDDPQLIKAYRSIASETYSSVSAPIQHAGIAAYDLNADIQSHIADSTAIHSMIGNYVYDKLSTAGFSVGKPEGAFYSFPTVEPYREKLEEHSITTSRELVYTLLKEYGVAVLAGSAFGLPNEELSFRMAYIDYDGRTVLKQYRNNKSVDSTEFIENNCPNVVEGMNRLSNFAKDYF